MDIISFIQFALQVWNTDHHQQVLPHVGRVQFQGVADGAAGADLGAWDLAILGAENALALERVEVLCERATEGAQVITFDDE